MSTMDGQWTSGHMGTSPQIYTVTILRAPNFKTHVYDDLLLLIFQSDPSNDEMIVGQA